MIENSELQQSLKLFREALVKVLAEMKIEILALQYAVETKGPLSREQFSKLQAKARKQEDRISDRLAALLPPAQTLR